MTDFAVKAPFNPEKPNELHARASLPAAPARSTSDFARHFLGLILGIIGTCIFVALAFQARAGWDNHREWVVATTLPGGAIAGVCLGFLLARGQVVAALPGIALLVVSASFAALNIWRGQVVDGPDVGRDILTVTSGVFLVFAGLAFLIAEIRVEWKDPARAPKPAI